MALTNIPILKRGPESFSEVRLIEKELARNILTELQRKYQNIQPLTPDDANIHFARLKPHFQLNSELALFDIGKNNILPLTNEELGLLAAHKVSDGYLEILSA